MATIQIIRAMVGGRRLQCPGRGVGNYPRRLTFITTGGVVHATCNERHRVPGTGPKAKCFWVVEGLTPAVVNTLADQNPGRIRAKLPTGKSIEGKLVKVSGPKTGKAAAAHGEKNAKDSKNGAAPPAPHAARNQSGGGTAKAAFVAVTAVAGAATAAANAVGATANAVGRGFDMGREGFRTGQVIAKEAGNAGARRFAERNATAPAAQRPTRRRRKKTTPSS